MDSTELLRPLTDSTELIHLLKDTIHELIHLLTDAIHERAKLREALECLVHRCEAEDCGTAWAPLHDARALLQQMREARTTER